MRLFRRGGADSVRSKGSTASARLASIHVGKESNDESTRATYAYTVELGPEHSGRRVYVGQHLDPLEYVRLGMPLVVWVHNDDVLIDAERTMAPFGVHGTTYTAGWKCGKDRGHSGITDDYIGIERNRKKGTPAAATVKAAQWKSAAFGLSTQLSIDTVVQLPGQQPYALELNKIDVPHYATHLLAVGAVLPVVVRNGRPDKVAIDWPAAAMAAPGVGVPPSALLGASAGPSGGISAGMWASTDEAGDDSDAGAFTEVSAALGGLMGANSQPGELINGVSFEQYLAIEVAIRRQALKPRDWDAFAQTQGVAPGTWAATSQKWGMQMARNPSLAQRYAAAIQ